MLYNKDTEYNIKYITVDGDKKEITYTPEKDMSVPEIINMLQDKDKDFYKLLKETKKQQIKEENKIMKEAKLPNISKFIYDLDSDKGNAWSVSSYTENGKGDKIIIVNKNGISDNTYEDIIKAVEKKYPQLKGYETENHNGVWFYLQKGNKNESEEIELQDADIEPEDITETQENMEQAVQELGEVTEEEEFGIDTIASTIDVLIADEQSAIDGYNSFLEQCRETIPEELYNTIEKELQEIIQDEQDHINKLVVIQESLNTDIAPSENTDIGIDMEDVDTVEENKQLEENSSHTFKYNKDDTVPYKGKEYKIVKVIPAHYWKGQNASDEEGEDNSFVEFTDDMYEIQNPKNSSDWGYVKATELEK